MTGMSRNHGQGEGRRLGFGTATAALVALFLIAPIIVPPARAELTLDWHTIDGGGHTFSVSGDLSLGGTAGQPDAGAAAAGSVVLRGGFWRGGGVVSSVPDRPDGGGEVLAFRIAAGLPNPFSDATRIILEFPETTPILARILDPSGRVVREVCRETLPAGRHLRAWTGRNDAGHRMPSGVYFLQLRAGEREIHRRLILLR